MVAIINPRPVEIMAFATDFPVKLATVDRPKSISAKNSAGPKRSAKPATGSPINVKTIMLKVPATNDPMAHMASAGPARPCNAILWPSRVVTTDADSPGILTRMDVVDPPYIAP